MRKRRRTCPRGTRDPEPHLLILQVELEVEPTSAVRISILILTSACRREASVGGMGGGGGRDLSRAPEVAP